MSPQYEVRQKWVAAKRRQQRSMAFILEQAFQAKKSVCVFSAARRIHECLGSTNAVCDIRCRRYRGWYSSCGSRLRAYARSYLLRSLRDRTFRSPADHEKAPLARAPNNATAELGQSTSSVDMRSSKLHGLIVPYRFAISLGTSLDTG